MERVKNAGLVFCLFVVLLVILSSYFRATELGTFFGALAGTPVLDCSGSYENGEFFLSVRQSMNPPFHIPFKVRIGEQEQVLSVKKSEEKFKKDSVRRDTTKPN